MCLVCVRVYNYYERRPIEVLLLMHTSTLFIVYYYLLALFNISIFMYIVYTYNVINDAR